MFHAFILGSLFFADIISSEKRNILLQAPEAITLNEVDRLAENACFEFSWGSINDHHITFSYHNADVEYEIVCFENLPGDFPVQIQDLFIISTRNNRKIYRFAFPDSASENPDAGQDPLAGYYLASPIKIVHADFHTITLEQVCDSISQKAIIFYTGAGISAAAGVSTLSKLESALSIDLAKKDVPGFVVALLSQPSLPAQIVKAFFKSALEAPPTRAHHALKEIALLKKCKIITENIDLLQERTGIKTIMPTPQILGTKISPEDLREIDYVICLGLSHDDRGFLGWYKQHNPDGKIIAINKEQPNYLSNEDFYLEADLQEALPAIHDSLMGS